MENIKAMVMLVVTKVVMAAAMVAMALDMAQQLF